MVDDLFFKVLAKQTYVEYPLGEKNGLYMSTEEFKFQLSESLINRVRGEVSH